MKNKNILWIIGIIIVVLIIAGGVYFLILKNPSRNFSNLVKQGTYINEENKTLRCLHQSLYIKQGDEYINISYYDESNDLIGSCIIVSGPVPLGCGFPGNCTSSNLLTEPVGQGECKGIRYEKYLCQTS